MIILLLGLRRVPIFSSEAESQLTRFSIVIPFRNESENIPALFETILKINYPSVLFEIIFVDDFSKDNSAEIIIKNQKISNFSIQLIHNKVISNSPKKDAISEAIKIAKYEWIVTTDADCELPENWLKILDGFIQSKEFEMNNPVMVCGPVVYKTEGSFLQNFQYFDGLSLQAVTLGSFGWKNPILCNGANLAYRKDAFGKVNGFCGNNHIASGDDIFLMEKMKIAFPKRVEYLKSRDAIVSTKPQYSWESVLAQRIRWVSKTSKKNNPISFFLGVLVFMVNLTFLLLPLILLFDINRWPIFLWFICFKIILDFVVTSYAGRFFEVKFSFWKFGLMPFVYSGITVLVIIKSFQGTYLWKNRKYSTSK